MKSNLVFRKIPSLQFLYEVSEDGRIVRNVKSKRHIKQIKDKDGYYHCYFNIKGHVINRSVASLVAECWLGERPEGYQIDHIDRNRANNHRANLRYVTHSEQMKNRSLSDRIIEQATQNCQLYVQSISKPVFIHNETECLYFESMSKCAEWLGKKYDKPSEHFRYKLKKKRSHIYDYDVIYLNVETVRQRPMGQETVHECIS